MNKTFPSAYSTSGAPELSPEELADRGELFSSEAQKRNLQELHGTLLSLFWNE